MGRYALPLKAFLVGAVLVPILGLMAILPTPAAAQPFSAQIQQFYNFLMNSPQHVNATWTFTNLVVTGTCTGCGGGGGSIGGSISQYQTAVGSGSNTIGGVSPGTAGQVLTSNGASANPSYQDSGGGTIGGSIASGQVAVGSGTNTITGSAGFLFDTSGKFLSIGAAASSSAAVFWSGYPAVYVEEQAGDLTPGFVSYVYNTTANFAGGNFPMRSRGTPAVPTAVLSGDNLGVAVEPTVYTGSAWGYGGSLYMEAGENWSSSATGTKFVMLVTPNGENQTASKRYDFSPTLLSAPGDISAVGLKTTGAASGKTIVCVDVSTGRLYASSSGVACAN